MLLRSLLGLLFVFWLGVMAGQAQDISGFWLGVTYPANPNQAVYNYTMTLTQTGTTLGGTTQTSNPNVPFGGMAYVAGQVSSAQVTFSEMDQNGSTAVKDICFWRGTMTYNATNESLIGTYENITNGSTCTKEGNGKVELYRIVLKSGTKFCKDSPVNLVVTGKNIRWYSSASRTNVLAAGNTYSPKISQTTTFYITQTLYQTESPAVPVTVEITEPVFNAIPLNTTCSQTDGAIQVTAVDTVGWRYSINGGAFQTNPLFTSLKPASYTVVAQDAAGCQAAKVVTLTADSSPTISQLTSTPPKCEPANGSVNVVAAGGKAPLTYSIDYGQTFQSSPIFNQLSGGTYTFRVRDANGCEVNKALSLPAYKPIIIQSTTGLPTTCGQADGQVAMTISGGIAPVQYSLDKQTFQSDNTFANLKSGEYILTAKDNEGCMVSQSIEVAASTGPQLADVHTIMEGCNLKNGAILITAKNSSDLLTYSLDDQTYQQAATFSALKGGNYTLTTKDANGCKLSLNVLVPVDCANQIQLPSAFSPNADQINDALTVHFALSSLTILRFTVYDRWGAVLYNRVNFELANGEPIWDGQLNGQAAPTGMYMYRLDCQFPDGTQTTYRESVALLNK
ncbi:gliding motility-associated C-terminal domain-containing protein [Spirosoma sp. KNUC1025]|uniref:T9SS type B sorting domain-containing protein n=1 Tax=Spirosoma sp. KNUC1025 TaxID=2894082 RepID=UPI00386D17E9|nr:gliding motility-associated C-terminal domain-containing protein [Spirosoma sp. KNUC1025]